MPKQQFERGRYDPRHGRGAQGDDRSYGKPRETNDNHGVKRRSGRMFTHSQDMRCGDQPRSTGQKRSRVKKPARLTDAQSNILLEASRARSALGPSTRYNAMPSSSTSPESLMDQAMSRFMRQSTVSYISAVAEHNGVACSTSYECARRNRQLRDYLNAVFDNARKAIEVWAYAAGVSVDRHMDWEHTKTRSVPEGLRRASEPCDQCCFHAAKDLREWKHGNNSTTAVPQCLPGDTTHEISWCLPQPESGHGLHAGNPLYHAPPGGPGLNSLPPPATLHPQLVPTEDTRMMSSTLARDGHVGWAKHGDHVVALTSAPQLQQCQDHATATVKSPQLGSVWPRTNAIYPTPSSDDSVSSVTNMAVSELLNPSSSSEAFRSWRPAREESID